MELYTALLQDSNKPEAHVTSYKVYVSGLKEDIEEADLHAYFSEYGAIESVEVIVDRDTRRPRGFAFVSFSDYDPVDKIVCKFICFVVYYCIVTIILCNLDSILRILQSLIIQDYSVAI